MKKETKAELMNKQSVAEWNRTRMDTWNQGYGQDINRDSRMFRTIDAIIEGLLGGKSIKGLINQKQNDPLQFGGN